MILNRVNHENPVILVKLLTGFHDFHDSQD